MADSPRPTYREALDRLASAEQALAAVEKLLNNCEMAHLTSGPKASQYVPFVDLHAVRAALRASQSGDSNCPAGGGHGDHESQWFEDEQSWRCLRCGRYFSNDAPVRASQGGQT